MAIVKRIKNRSRGVTLVELMVAVAIGGVIVTITPTLLRDTFKMWKLTEARTVTQQDARITLNLVEGLLRQASASSIVVTRHNNSEPPYSKITFSMPDNHIYHFYQNDDELWIYHLDPDGTTYHQRAIADGLRYVTFGFPQIDVENLLSVAICYEKSTYESETKTFYLSTQRVKVMNS